MLFQGLDIDTIQITLLKGVLKKKAILYSNCQGTRHNRRMCRFALAHSRRQRARDRESIADSDLDSDIESTVDESTVDGDSELAEQGRAANIAWEVVERNHSLFEGLNSDTDSELSMLASSQIDSIESIKGIGVTRAGSIASIGGDSEAQGTIQGMEISTYGEGKVTRCGRRVK